MTWTSDKLRRFLLISADLKLKNRCSHVVFAIIAVTLMRIDTQASRAVMEHPCDADVYQHDANCLVEKPKSVAMPGVCPSLPITHWLGNRGQHLLWRHLRGMLFHDSQGVFGGYAFPALSEARIHDTRTFPLHPWQRFQANAEDTCYQ
jgi:hypothetical protein